MVGRHRLLARRKMAATVRQYKAFARASRVMLAWNICNCSHDQYESTSSFLISPLPVKPGGGTLGFLTVCQSVCPSVCPSLCPSVCPSLCPSVCPSVHSVSVHSVFRIFLSCPFRYWLEIWYTTLSWHDTDQVRLLSWLTYFYLSYCPLQKITFRNFSLPSFVILTWNLLYEFVLTWYRSSWLLSRLTYFYMSYCPLLKVCFPDFSSLYFEILTWNFIHEFV